MPKFTRQYRDIDYNFKPNLGTGDIYKKHNDNAIKQSLKSLILTNHYERPFHPEIGSNIPGLLFEPFSPILKIQIEKEIVNIIQNFEPRVRLESVKLIMRPDEHEIDVTIYFVIVNTLIPLQVDFILKRTR